MSAFLRPPKSESASTDLSERLPNSAANVASMPLADRTAEEQAEHHYLAVINPLLNEAFEQRSMGSFVDVLTWTLARVIVGLDKPQITGDILRRIGNYTYRLAESNQAQAEADRARKEGRAPN